ncbi:outer membrane protein assembly factor BamE [Ramlibacter tataouinensis]|uniref:outer membrane protein assembly factor BamE domain-containing protein n=1 Tax=Ramlibacter tataouinensis TaxID=94132 RepID=UPI0022F3D81F|nr:outer membrane protein assembly factor BamE [Ramlibacter tataouinensis]WBY03966.1 outer membrane protein assembly factor BamE [Ramlibacter tataouinensis]
MGFFAALLALLALLPLAGCDQRRIEKLEEGVSTEADVRAQFGAPENVWDEPGGARTLEYNRNPAGHQNYMITIGPDGRMSALRQVLNPTTFARVQPGMAMEQVRRLLGKPAKKTPYALKGEEAWDWRWMQSPGTSMVFTVWFDKDWHVVRTTTEPDPEAPENRGGPSR